MQWDVLVNLFNSGFNGEHAPLQHDLVPWPPNTFEFVHAGKRFLNGDYFLVLWSLPADLEYYGNELRLSHHNSNYPCDFCPACRDSTSDFSITDVRLDAPWKNHIISFLAGMASVSVHPCFGILRALLREPFLSSISFLFFLFERI